MRQYGFRTSWRVSAIVQPGLYLIIVDSNATCRGGFVQGSGQRVLTPGLFREYCPDLHLLASVTWERGVTKQVEEMGIRCDFLVAS
jgi:hypothetical protein